MTATLDAPPRARRSVGLHLLRFIGWTLVGTGLLILLYLVYSLFFTGVATQAAQSDLQREWTARVGDVPVASAEPPAEVIEPAPPPEPAPEPALDLGGAVAVLEFARPGSDVRPVQAEPLFVVEGVTLSDLQRGPGRYPGTAMPGQPGNFAVAGHRTTYGAPFFHLDQLQPGDEVHVTDRAAARWVYRVVEERVVGPDDVSVIGPDPLGTGAPTLTLTTCHPRFSARQRLIVFAELVP
jgi:sortase A